MTSKLRRALILGVGLAATAAAGCTEVGTDPDQPVSISFDTLPSPAVVYGDTLRDLMGVVVPLTAHAYNVDGDEIPDAPIDYFVSDTLAVRIDTATNVLVAGTDTTKRSVTIRAQAAGIPSGTSRTLELVPSPDTMERAAGVPRDRIDTVRFADTDTAITSGQLISRVLHRADSLDPSVLTGVRGWRVRYSVAYAGAVASPDTLLVDDANRKSVIDTTGTDGSASRRLRLRRPSAGAFPDSIVVEATAWYLGVIPGAPVRFIVLVRPNA